MGRQARIEYPGAVYLLQSRGNGNAPIFRDHEDRILFLELLDGTCRKAQWQVHAFGLTPATFQLVVATSQANLVIGMKWFLGAYTNKFNRKHKNIGHVFAGRYRSLVVDSLSSTYFAAACLNTHAVASDSTNDTHAQSDDAFPPWSSLTLYRHPEHRKWRCMTYSRLFEALNAADDESGCIRVVEETQRWQSSPPVNLLEELRRGWCLGSQEFKRNLTRTLVQNKPDLVSKNREFTRTQAEAILQKELFELGWDESQLAQRLKGDAEKVRIARLLRQETTISLRWVAERLHMGSWTHAANCIYSKTMRPKTKIPKRRISTMSSGSLLGQKKTSQTPAVSDQEATVPHIIEELPLHCL